jgi:antitoxin VapB
MTLQIRDKRAHDLARRLSEQRGVTMTEAVIQALEAELRRQAEQTPLSERVAHIAAELAEAAGPNRRTMTKDEIAEMWGH